MARWAENAVYVTIGALILTGIGILLIAGTLVYTKRAAVAAADMVTEAAKTTKLAADTLKESQAATVAAAEAASHTKRQADIAERSYRRLERPYLFVKIVQTDRLGASFRDQKPSLDYIIVNYGKTPAIFKSIFLELRPLSELQFLNGRPRIPIGVPEKEWYEVLAQGDATGKRTVEVLNSNLGDRVDPNVSLALHGRLIYEDSNEVFYADHFVLLRQDGRFCLKYSHHHTEDPEDRKA